MKDIVEQLRAAKPQQNTPERARLMEEAAKFIDELVDRNTAQQAVLDSMGKDGVRYPNIPLLVHLCFKNSFDHGFHDQNFEPEVERVHGMAVEEHRLAKRNIIPEKLCLIHSEVSEALEAFREDLKASSVGKSKDDYYIGSNGKPLGIVSELADVVIRVFDLCGAFEWDLDKAIRDKMNYNASRPFKHGKRI